MILYRQHNQTNTNYCNFQYLLRTYPSFWRLIFINEFTFPNQLYVVK